MDELLHLKDKKGVKCVLCSRMDIFHMAELPAGYYWTLTTGQWSNNIKPDPSKHAGSIQPVCSNLPWFVLHFHPLLLLVCRKCVRDWHIVEHCQSCCKKCAKA